MPTQLRAACLPRQLEQHLYQQGMEIQRLNIEITGSSVTESPRLALRLIHPFCLCERFDLDVLMERIEEEVEPGCVFGLSAKSGQGYLFGRPFPFF